MSGNYNERVIVNNSGNDNNYIVFKNYQNDEIIINGNSISWGSAWNGLFDVSSRSYIIISGLNIINADYGGIWADESDHIIIKNNYTYNTFSCGIGVWNSNNISIEENEVELACSSGEQECISVANSFNCEIFKNNVHHNGDGSEGGEGIDVKEGSHDINVFQNEVHHLNERTGIYADAWNLHTYNINIYQNKVHHCAETGISVASENGGEIEYVNIFNNLVYFNKYGGIELGEWSDIGYPGPKPLTHIKIINNTCYKNGEYDGGWGFGIAVDNPDASDIVIRNNICSENSAQISIKQINTGRHVDHNLIYGNNIAEGTLNGTDSVIANPLFVNADAYNFQLLNTSPAIDNGSFTDAPNFDFENTNRPYGDYIDIGAFEYNPSSDIKNIRLSEKKFQINPNPACCFLKINRLDKTMILPNEVQIMNVTGKKYISKINNETGIIDISSLSTGIYFLKIANQTYKFIKQ